MDPAKLNAFIAAFNAWQEEAKPEPIEGDGNAQMLEPMTEAEYAKWVHEQDHGWKKVYDRILRR